MTRVKTLRSYPATRSWCLETTMTRTSFPFPIAFLALIALAGLSMALPCYGQQEENNSGASQSQNLDYSNEASPANDLVFDLNGATAYDDNVFGDNQHRVGDEVFEGGGRLGIHEQKPLFDFKLDYSPEAVIYEHIQGFNRANHSAKLDAGWKPEKHFELRIKDNSSYTTGVFFASPNASFSPQNEPPPAENLSLYTPLARALSNQGRADAIVKFTTRLGIDLFGHAENQIYSGESGPSLFNSIGDGVGSEISYRISKTVTYGAEYLIERQEFGAFELDQIQSGYFSLEWHAAPQVYFSLFAGPQHAALTEYNVPAFLASGSSSTITPPGLSTMWEPAAGGTITWRSPSTAIVIGGQRVLTGGGGLLGAAVNAREDTSVRRRLLSRWDLLLSNEVSRSSAIGQLIANGSVDDQTFSASLEYRVNPAMRTQFGYSFIRQRINGTVPFLADMDRNYVSFSVFFEPARIALGR